MNIKTSFYYPNQIVSTITTIEGTPTQITYVKDVEKNIVGSEVYMGKNYIPESTNRSYSRSYKGIEMVNKMPVKYHNTVRQLAEEHNKVDWAKILQKRNES